MVVRPDRLPLGSLDADDLQGAHGALAARIPSVQEVEGEVDCGAEVHGLEANSEIEGRFALEDLVNFVEGTPGRMAKVTSHARLLSLFTLRRRRGPYNPPNEEGVAERFRHLSGEADVPVCGSSPFGARPMRDSMRGVLRLCKSPRGRLFLNLGTGVFAIGISLLAARHFAEVGWPLAHADFVLVAFSGVLFLLAYAFKAYGWRRLFAPHERPRSLTLAAAGGAACVTGAALPGRFDDVVRVAVVRRASSVTGVPTVCLSLFMLGLVDTAALMPFASVAAAAPDTSMGVRAAMGVVAFAGFGAAVVIAVLPRLTASGRLVRFRLARWMSERSLSPREAWKAWILVLASWLTRALGLFVLLAALGVSISLPLAIAFLCAAAASGALPVAPAGAATQAGAGAAILVASGIGTAQAISFAVAAQALLIVAGAAVLVFAAAWHGGARLALRRAALIR